MPDNDPVYDGLTLREAVLAFAPPELRGAYERAAAAAVGEKPIEKWSEATQGGDLVLMPSVRHELGPLTVAMMAARRACESYLLQMVVDRSVEAKGRLKWLGGQSVDLIADDPKQLSIDWDNLRIKIAGRPPQYVYALRFKQMVASASDSPSSNQAILESTAPPAVNPTPSTFGTARLPAPALAKQPVGSVDKFVFDTLCELFAKKTVKPNPDFQKRDSGPNGRKQTAKHIHGLNQKIGGRLYSLPTYEKKVKEQWKLAFAATFGS